MVAHTPTDFESASEAIAELNTRLGITGRPLRERSKQFLELSRITGSDLPEDIKTVTRAFGDWEVAQKQQGKTLDFFFRASQESGASVSDLAAEVVKFGAPLRQIGFSLQEATAMFAEFEKAGVNTSTMMPGLKMAMKSFFEENKDPKKGILETFKGVEDGSIKTAEALKIFGTRAGGDFIEAIEQGRFHLKGFTEQIATGKDTILGVGEETKHASERFQELGNAIKVKLEPAATAVFNTFGQFAGELSKLDFHSPISGAVAFGLAFAGVAVSVLAAKSAIQATWVLMAENPFGAVVLGAGLAVGALLALNHSSEKNINVFKRSKRVLGDLSAASQNIHRVRGQEKQATDQVRAAEQRLTSVRKKYGPNSQQAIEAEAQLARKRQRLKDLTEQVRNLERKHGVERHAAAILITSDSKRLARQSEVLREQQEKEVGQLKHLVTNRKSLAQAGLDTSHITDLIGKKQKELGDTTDSLNGKNKQLAEITLRAGNEIGPKYAGKLQETITKTQKATRRTSELGRWLDKLPPKRKVDVDVEIHVGGVNMGGGGGGRQGGGGGGTGDGWGMGKAINAGIDDKVKKKVQDYADENPLALLGGGLGDAAIGPHVPGAWKAFIPFAEKFGLTMTSGFRPGSITSSGNESYHAMNRAGDFSNGVATPQEYAFGMFMANAFGSVLKELIHTPLGFSIKDGARVAPYAAAEHHDHVHVAYQEGGTVVPGTGSGDKVPMQFMAEPGERLFVLNRNASATLKGLNEFNAAFPRFQKGGEVTGRATWFDGARSTAGGSSTSKPGLALNLNPGTDSGWNNATTQRWMEESRAGHPVYGRTSIGGKTANLPITDLGPAGWTGNAIDVTAGGVRKLGFTTDNFPSGSTGKVSILDGSGGSKDGHKRTTPKAHPGKTGKGGGSEGPGGKKRKGEKSPYSPGRTSVPGTKAAEVPKILAGLGKGITNLFTSPGLTREGRFKASELALGIAEDTEGTEDDEAVLKYQLGASRQRKKKIQQEINRLNKRLKGRLTEKQRKQIIAKRDGLIDELGTAQGRIGSAREGLAGLAEEAADPLQEAIEKQTEATEAARQAEEEHTAAIKELQGELELNRHIAESEAATSGAVARTALADIISGQLGPRASHKSNTMGAGSVGNF